MKPNKTYTDKSRITQRSSSTTENHVGRATASHLTSNNPGTGLWVYSKPPAEQVDLPKMPQIPQNTMQSQKSASRMIDKKVDDSIIKLLEKKIEDLAKELESEQAEKIQLRLELNKQLSIIAAAKKEVQIVKGDNVREKDKKIELTQNYDNLIAQLNSSKREISKLQYELDSLKREKNMTVEQLDGMANRHENLSSENKKHIKILQNKIEELEEEKEELRNKLQIREEIHKDINDTRQRQYNDFLKKALEKQGSKMDSIGRLTADIATLQEKLNESESLRKKFQSRNKELESKIEELTKDNELLYSKMEKYKKESIGVRAAKSTGSKVTEKKNK